MKDMLYSEFVEVYDKLASTTKRLEKVDILSGFLKELKKRGDSIFIYLLKGRVVPDYDPSEIGISNKLAIKALSKGLGVSEEEVNKMFRKSGDLGEIAEELAEKKRQMVLFSSKLTAEKIFDNLRKIMKITGKGAVTKKLELISELFANANAKETKYIIRTLLSDLRIGVADGIIRDAIAKAFLDNNEESKNKVEEAFGLSGDFAVVFEEASKGRKALEGISISPGKPMNVMLAIKAEDLKDAFRICGKPAAFEYKYDGFRMVISKKGKEIKLFTRRLEDVTKQFPDVIEIVNKNVKAESFILDSEIVGYDRETKKYKPFEAVSQRIKRKYEIEKLMKELPVEINVFDILYLNGKSLMKEPFEERRKIVEKMIYQKNKIIVVTKQIITEDEKKAEKFYNEAVKNGLEGVIVKNLRAEYRQGRYVGYMAKVKPEVRDLDLVIVGAEYGSGKRGGWLTSYYVACKNDGKFKGIGKVSSGLKEKESGEEGAVTYEEMTKILKPLIEKEKSSYVKIKPKIVVSVTYQNIQKSPAYDSGFALRFPRINRYRPDKAVKEIATLKEIEKEVKKAGRKG